MTLENIRTIGESKSDNVLSFDSDTNARRQLRIVSDAQKSIIYIEENTHKHPFSWFLTHPSGKTFISGRVEKSDQEIKLLGLERGLYHFRTQGEVYEISVA